jgi:hypothetical protein
MQNPNRKINHFGFRRTRNLERIKDMNSRPTVKTDNAPRRPFLASWCYLNLGVATGVACTIPKRFYGLLND